MRTTVDLYGGSRVAVALLASPERWPAHEESDRLAVPLGIAALALARSDEDAIERVRVRLRAAARALAGADPGLGGPAALCEEVSGLELVRPGAAGQPRVVAQLIRSAVGPVTTVGRASPGAFALAAAATATMGVCLGDADPETHLAEALAVEGLLGWYREADPHLQPPQQAVAYSLRYAASRLSEAGRVPPAGLASAVEEHRKITPMAGGA